MLIENGITAELTMTSALLDNGVMYWVIPASPGCEDAPVLALFGHVDSYGTGVPEVEPVIREFDGRDCALERCDTIIPVDDLTKAGLQPGDLFISSMGDSVLAADNKAGVAATLTALNDMMNPTTDTPMIHGPLVVALFPDEEIGRMDASLLPKDILDTIDVVVTPDGGAINEVDVACYVGRSVKITFSGDDGYPVIAASRFITRLGEGHSPWCKGDDGGYQYAMEIIENARFHGSTEKMELVLLGKDELTDDETERTQHITALAEEISKVHDVKFEYDGGVLQFMGRDAHPGPDGDKIKSAVYAAADFMLRADKNKDLLWISETCDTELTVHCIPRAFFDDKSLERVEELRQLAGEICHEMETVGWSEDVTLQYVSTGDTIAQNQWCMGPIRDALEELGIEIDESRAEGGTDGAMFNMLKPHVPAPNCGVGPRNIHQLPEFIPVKELEQGPEYMRLVILGFSRLKRSDLDLT
jgi:di/tripeptidase